MIATWTTILFLLVLDKPFCTRAYVSGCIAEYDTIYGILWPSVNCSADTTVSVPCSRGTGNATRVCNVDGKWESPMVTRCSSFEITGLMEKVSTDDDLIILTNMLAMITNTTDSNVSLYPSDLMDTNSVLQCLLNRITTIPEILSLEVVQNIVESFSNVLNPTNNAGWMELQMTNPNQSQILLMNAERFGRLLADNDSEIVHRIFTSNNIVIETKLVDAMNTEDIKFLAANGNSVTIPASYIQQHSAITGVDQVTVICTSFENIENLLPVNGKVSNIALLISQLLSIQVTNASVIPPPDNSIELTLHYSTENLNDSSILTCGYWNFSINKGRGGWDSEGVTVMRNDINSSTITCHSYHLASFVVLAGPPGGQAEDVTEEQSSSVHLVSYIGCGISIAFLLATAVALVLYRKSFAVFPGLHGFIHANMVITLLLALVIFVCGIEAATDNKVACEAVAILLQYFFTAAFTWLLCEGILFFSVTTRNTFMCNRREIFYITLGWGIPIPIVTISAGVAHDQYGHEDFCWVDTRKRVFWGFAASVMSIFIVDLILLIISFLMVCKDRTSECSSLDSYVILLMRNSTILLLLLGITWTFSVLAVNQESNVFDWLFAFLNSLQGILIFVLYIIENEMTKQRLLTCCRYILHTVYNYLRIASHKCIH